MARTIRRRASELAALCGFAIIASWPAATIRADPAQDSVGEVEIRDAVAEPAGRGGFTNVSLRLENSGARTVRVTRVATVDGEPGEFRFHGNRPHGSGATGPRLAPASPGLTIPPGEEARLDSHHLHLAIGPLKRDLREGDTLEITFTFDNGITTTVPVHVHKEAPSKQPSR